MADKNYIFELQKLTNNLLKEFSFKEFFYGIMKTFNLSKSYINEAWSNKPAYNCANSDGRLEFDKLDPKLERPDIGLQKRGLFRFVKNDEDVREQLDQAVQSFNYSKFKIPLVIAVGPSYICLFNAIDNEFSSFDLDTLPQNFALLMPLTASYKGRIEISASTEADEKACRKLTQLMDIIEQSNDMSQVGEHALNDFMRRLVFCLFAEDTGLFKNNLFTSNLAKLTGLRGEGGDVFFRDLFQVLNTPEDQRGNLKVNQALLDFPYVGGGLFAEDGFIPKIDMRTRNRLIDCGRIEWNKISPAIFGSLFQYAMDPKERRQFGAHYTSEQNILKVIRPLFLDALTQKVEEFENEYRAIYAEEVQATEYVVKGTASQKTTRQIQRQIDSKLEDFEKRVRAFHDSLGQLKFLDPACGCGNFLVVTYRELRKLENGILHFLYKEGSLLQSFVSKVSIEQFYGIEIEDWPTEIAQLSMWLMQHQMNRETERKFGKAPASLPLSSSAHIRCANALTTDWNDILPAKECSYIIGNPPFGGAVTISKDQKTWLQNTYPKNYKIGRVDFVTAWFVKAANYMQSNKSCRSGFVATNSICQGQQVSTLWGLLIKQGVFINFAYTSFQWTNEARNNAGVICVIVGFSYQDIRPALLFKEQSDGSFSVKECQVISPYLIEEKSQTIVKEHVTSISASKAICFGNMPVDNGCLLLSPQECNSLSLLDNSSFRFLKLFIGSSELCNNTWRYCLWLTDETRQEWGQIPLIVQKVEACRAYREGSVKTGDAYKLRLTPWKFRSQMNPSLAIVVPRVTSERRPYIPLTIINNLIVVSDRCFIIPNGTMFDYAILYSRMHNEWMRFSSGRIKMDYTYSRDLTYNTFIWPELNDARKLELSVLGSRLFDFCSNSDLTLGELNNPESMPIELKLLHDQLDALVESYYRPEPFEDDEDRLSFLIGLYSRRIQEIEQEGKARGKKKANESEPEPFVWNSVTTGEGITPWLTPLNAMHIMVKGASADDNAFLHLNKDEVLYLFKTSPEAKRYVRRVVSSSSFYDGRPSYCLWLHEEQDIGSNVSKKKGRGKVAVEPVNTYAWKKVPFIKQRVELCKAFRMAADHNSLAYRNRYKAFSFSKVTYPPLTECKLMMPRLIRKEFDCIPTWMSTQPIVANDSVCVVPTENIIDSALLNSRMHWVWMCATSDFDAESNVYLYSIEKTYNNLIWPHVPDELKSKLTEATTAFMQLTNCYAERFGQPLNFAGAGAELVEARARLDNVVERCYRDQPFNSDEERLEFLKQLYLKYKF